MYSPGKTPKHPHGRHKSVSNRCSTMIRCTFAAGSYFLSWNMAARAVCASWLGIQGFKFIHLQEPPSCLRQPRFRNSAWVSCFVTPRIYQRGRPLLAASFGSQNTFVLAETGRLLTVDCPLQLQQHVLVVKYSLQRRSLASTSRYREQQVFTIVVDNFGYRDVRGQLAVHNYQWASIGGLGD